MSISIQIGMYHDALNSYWSGWFSVLLIFKIKQYKNTKNANIANFVYYGKTRGAGGGGVLGKVRFGLWKEN